MALATPGPLGIVSGVVGGAELAVVGGRSVVKTRKRRQGPTTPRQLRAHDYHARAIRHWQGLSVADQEAWRIAAETNPRRDRLGTMRPLNGFQLFMTIPHNWGYIGSEEFIDVPPTETTLQPGFLSAYCHSGNVLNTFGSLWYVGLTSYQSLLISRFRPTDSVGRAYTFFDTGMKLIVSGITSYESILNAENVMFITGETLQIVVTCWNKGRWPRTIAAFTIVVAP